MVVGFGRFPTSIFLKACFSATFRFAAFYSPVLRSELSSGGCLERQTWPLSAKIISLSHTRRSQVFQCGTWRSRLLTPAPQKGAHRCGALGEPHLFSLLFVLTPEEFRSWIWEKLCLLAWCLALSSDNQVSSGRRESEGSSLVFSFSLTLLSQKSQMLEQKVRTGWTHRKFHLVLSQIIIPALQHFSRGKTSKQQPNEYWQSG